MHEVPEANAICPLTAWLRYLELTAKVFVDRRWPEINAVADALLAKRTLSEGDVLDAIRAASAHLVPTPVPPSE